MYRNYGNKTAKKNNNPNNKERRQVGGVCKTPKSMKPHNVFPAYSIHKLTYKSDLTLITSGSTFLVKSFRANSLYDPDPAILSSGYAGFSWLAQAYDEYLVQSSRVRCWAGNQNSSFVSFGVVYSLEQLDATIGSWQEARDALENKFSTRTTQLTAKGIGGCSRSVSGQCALQDITKAGVYQYSDIYTGLSTADPTYIIWVSFIAFSDDGSTPLTDGIVMDFTLESTAEFYSPKTLKDTLDRVIRSPIIKDDCYSLTLDLGKGTSGKYRHTKTINRVRSNEVTPTMLAAHQRVINRV